MYSNDGVTKGREILSDDAGRQTPRMPSSCISAPHTTFVPIAWDHDARHGLRSAVVDDDSGA